MNKVLTQEEENQYKNDKEIAIKMTLTNSLDDLCFELKEVCEVNANLLCYIKSSESNEVICGYRYSVQLNLPPKQIIAITNGWNDEVFSLLPEKITEDVSARLNKWRYNGEKLSENVKTYADVIYLNDQLLNIGNKIS
eukprot:10699112-Ditylum_brightwellii.AAC.1